MDPRIKEFFGPSATPRMVGPATQKLGGTKIQERGYGFAFKAVLAAGLVLAVSAAPVRAQSMTDQSGIDKHASVDLDQPASVDLDQPGDTASIWINPETGKLYAPVPGANEAVVVNRGALAKLLVQAGSLPNADDAAPTLPALPNPAPQPGASTHSVAINPDTNKPYGNAAEGGDGIIVNRAAMAKMLQSIGNTPEIDDEPIEAPAAHVALPAPGPVASTQMKATLVSGTWTDGSAAKGSGRKANLRMAP